MVKSASGKKNMRSFEVVEAGKHGNCKTKSKPGRYISRAPYGAALKAFNRLCAKKRIRGRCTLVMAMKETTAGSKHKVFRYKLTRAKLAQPIVIKGKGGERVIEYSSRGKAVGTPEPCKRPGQTRGRMKTKTRGRKSRRLTPNNVRRKITRALKRLSKK